MKSKIPDYILIGILTVLLIGSSYFLWSVRSIPNKFKIAALAVFILVYLILVAFTFKKLQSPQLWIRRFFIVIFCIVYGWTGFTSFRVDNAILKTTTEDENKFISISVVVKADSSIKSAKDLDGKTVGVQNNFDKTNAEYGEKQLNKDANNVKYEAKESYTDLSNLLSNNEIDAMIITNSAINNIAAEHEGYKDTIKIIDTYKMKVTAKDTAKKTRKTSNERDLTKAPFTVLLSGIDTSDNGEQSNRSDVNMVLIVNPLTNHVEMISFPRDSYIPNLALGGINDKLTHTGNDGIENTVKSLENVLDFKIDFYVQVNFTSVVEIVNTMGGIEVDVPIDFVEQDSNRSFEEGDLIKINKGLQTLNGEQALAYARNRHDQPDGDLGRTRAQQDVVQAMVNRLLTTEGALKAPAILDIVPDYVDTDVSYEQISDFVNAELDNLQPWTFGTTSLENGTTDMLTTASMGNMLLSCYVLNLTDLETVYHKYQSIVNPITFSNFAFNLNDLEGTLPDYVRPDGIIFYGEDFSGYQGGETYPIDSDGYTLPEDPYYDNTQVDPNTDGNTPPENVPPTPQDSE